MLDRTKQAIASTIGTASPRRKLALFAGMAAAALVAVLLLARWLLVATVTTAMPTRGDAAEVVYATGVVEPVYWAKVVALQRKRIVDMCNCEGREVRKGDLLARLDDVEERARLTELQVRRDRLKEDAERLRVLLDRDAASRMSYDEKLTQISEYEARIAAQQERLRDLELRAPIDGVVLRADGHVGEIAATGINDVLFWVGQPTPLRVNADVNEEDVTRLVRGQIALLRHDSLGDRPLTATLQDITPKGDPETKTFRAYIALPVATPLKIGMSVEANVVVREVKDALLVPAEAVSNGAVQTIVDGRLAIVPVEVGVRGARLVEIKSGLTGASPVLVPPSQDLDPGARVRASARTGASR